MEKINKFIFQACIFQGWHKFILGLLIPILVLFQLDFLICLSLIQQKKWFNYLPNLKNNLQLCLAEIDQRGLLPLHSVR